MPGKKQGFGKSWRRVHNNVRPVSVLEFFAIHAFLGERLWRQIRMLQTAQSNKWS